MHSTQPSRSRCGPDHRVARVRQAPARAAAQQFHLEREDESNDVDPITTGTLLDDVVCTIIVNNKIELD